MSYNDFAKWVGTRIASPANGPQGHMSNYLSLLGFDESTHTVPNIQYWLLIYCLRIIKIHIMLTQIT